MELFQLTASVLRKEKKSKRPREKVRLEPKSTRFLSRARRLIKTALRDWTVLIFSLYGLCFS